MLSPMLIGQTDFAPLGARRKKAVRRSVERKRPLLILEGRSRFRLSVLSGRWAARCAGRGGERAGRRKVASLGRCKHAEKPLDSLLRWGNNSGNEGSGSAQTGKPGTSFLSRERRLPGSATEPGMLQLRHHPFGVPRGREGRNASGF